MGLQAGTVCRGVLRQFETSRTNLWNKGGHTKAATYRSFLAHEEQYGTEEAVKIARLEYDNIVATHAVAKKQGIDCDSTPCETVDIIYSESHLRSGLKAIERIQEAMGPNDPAAQYRTWTAEEAQEKFMTPGALGAFQYEAGSISAYKFTTGVLKLCLEKGLNLQTNTPALTLAQTPSGLRTVKTPRGRIATPNIILATNGYTPHLLPQTQGMIVPLRGQVCARRPGLMMPQTGLQTTYSFIYEEGYEYMISRPPGSINEGDIVIGGGLGKLPSEGASQYGNTDDTGLHPDTTKYLRNCTAYYFGSNWGADHSDGRVRKEWSGIMGASADGLPYVGQVPDMPGLFLSASFNGHGMVLCLKCAEALVQMITGGKSAEDSLNTWFPAAMRLTRERFKNKFIGRLDMKAPGEAEFGQRSRL